MNIPLNIDWQQIFLHLINFSVLTLGLYLLLYNPIKSFMDERTDYYAKLDFNTKEKLKQAEELKNSYKESQGEVEAEIEEKRASAKREARHEADLLLKNAKEQATKLILEAREAARQESKKILEDTQEEIAYIAMAAAEKLITHSASGALDEFLAIAKKE